MVLTHATRVPVVNIAGRTQLWGAATGDKVGAAVRAALLASRGRLVAIDLDGIKAFDEMFAEHAFLPIINYAHDSRQPLCFVVNDEAALSDLDSLFRQHKLMVPVSDGRAFHLAGEVYFHDR